MKNTKNSTDRSTPYRTLGLGKIDAPCKPVGEPRVTKNASGSDMRGGKKNA